MKAIIDADSGQILGCAILGSEAGEIMTMIRVAMLAKLTYTGRAQRPLRDVRQLAVSAFSPRNRRHSDIRFCARAATLSAGWDQRHIGGDARLFGHATPAICRHQILSPPTVAGTGRLAVRAVRVSARLPREGMPAGACGRSPGPDS